MYDDNSFSNGGCLEGFVWSFVIVVVVAIILWLCGELEPTESNFSSDHGYSAYKERRDNALERANKAHKDGDDEMANSWIQRGQEAQDSMNNAQRKR
jgi:hypothetical protein